MGLIKAAMGAAGGVMADQWKEFFYCDSMDKDVMVKKGQKRVSGRSSNTKGSDNIITNGSGIAVADGQCMIIVEQGKIVEVCAEPGEFTYDSSTEPSLPLILLQSHLFLPVVLDQVSKQPSQPSENDSPMAEIPEKIREYIISIQKS